MNTSVGGPREAEMRPEEGEVWMRSASRCIHGSSNFNPTCLISWIWLYFAQWNMHIPQHVELLQLSSNSFSRISCVLLGTCVLQHSSHNTTSSKMVFHGNFRILTVSSWTPKVFLEFTDCKSTIISHITCVDYLFIVWHTLANISITISLFNIDNTES